MRVCVYVLHAFSHARPCSSTSSPTFGGFAICPRPHPRSGGFATRLLPFAGLQPAPCLFCSLPRVADPATGAGGLQTRQNVYACVVVCFGGVGVCVGVFSSPTSSLTFRRVCNPPVSFCGFATRHACFVRFPGSQTRPRMLAGCKPARTWMLAWLFVLGVWVFVWVGVFSSLTSSPTFRRVCNPPVSCCGFATRHACFVRFPGSQTRPRMLAGCKPARTWMLAWLFVLGVWMFAWVFAWVFVFGGSVFAWLFVKDFCQSCRGKGLQANPLTHKRIRKRPVMQCKTGRLGLPDRPFWRAKEAVWHGHTAGMARRASVCKYFSRCGRRGGRGASSLRQYDAVQAMPAAITRSRMALSCSGVALRSSRSGVSRSMVYIITLPGAMYLTFSSHGPT